jgi:hypothetical protein
MTPRILWRITEMKIHYSGSAANLKKKAELLKATYEYFLFIYGDQINVVINFRVQRDKIICEFKNLTQPERKFEWVLWSVIEHKFNEQDPLFLYLNQKRFAEKEQSNA